MNEQKSKPKEYLIKAFNPLDKTFSCLAFRYDNAFFSDIIETLNSRNRNPCISFPVDTDFFQVFTWQTTNGLSRVFSLKDLEKDKFVFVEKYYKKAEDKNKLQTSRLHIVENTFHFSAISNENISYNTEDFNVEFLNRLKNFHIERWLSIV